MPLLQTSSRILTLWSTYTALRKPIEEAVSATWVPDDEDAWDGISSECASDNDEETDEIVEDGSEQSESESIQLEAMEDAGEEQEDDQQTSRQGEKIQDDHDHSCPRPFLTLKPLSHPSSIHINQIEGKTKAW